MVNGRGAVTRYDVEDFGTRNTLWVRDSLDSTHLSFKSHAVGLVVELKVLFNEKSFAKHVTNKQTSEEVIEDIDMSSSPPVFVRGKDIILCNSLSNWQTYDLTHCES